MEQIEIKHKYMKLLEKYNIKVESSGGKNILAFCPFHDDQKASLSINTEIGIYNCFSNQCNLKSGNFDKLEQLLNQNLNKGKCNNE